MSSTREGSARAFVNARLLDARSSQPINDGILVVDDAGRISAVGSHAQIPVPSDAQEIDLAGLMLMPGLIDCHVHLTMRLEPLHESVQRSWTDRIVMALDWGKALVEGGITTVRDAGGCPAGIRTAFSSGRFKGPRTQVSVNFLSQTGGHGDGHTLSGVDLKGPLPPDLPSGIADGPEEVRRAARLQIRAGADWIKVMASGGVLSAGDKAGASQFTVEEMRAAVEEAAAAGLLGVLAHAAETRGIKNALRAGITSIEHGDLLDDEAIDMMLERGATLVPTLLMSEELLSPERISRGEVPPWAVKKMTETFELQKANFRRAANRGVHLAMGSDAVYGMYPPKELSLMVHNGLAPHDAIRAATEGAARLLGLTSETGTLEVGKAADLIVVDGDPLEEPELWEDPNRIVLTMAQGTVMADRRKSRKPASV